MEKLELSKITRLIDPIEEMRTTRWFLVTSEDETGINTLTAAWGAFGNVWEKKTITIYIRPQRYTKKFIDNSNEFTITFFDGHLDEMRYLGRVSGKDEKDKIKKSNLNLIRIKDKPTFKEGKIMMICKVIYKETLKKENFIDENIPKNIYPNDDYSTMYIAEIKEAYIINDSI
jgi:flavin reductase (DIM6/NTAB) family NADH-FMN oxidoreductase RutF